MQQILLLVNGYHRQKWPTYLGRTGARALLGTTTTKKAHQKIFNSKRMASKYLKRINEYFVKLNVVILDESIIPDDIWNMDETSFRIKVGNNQMAITERKRTHCFNMSES